MGRKEWYSIKNIDEFFSGFVGIHCSLFIIHIIKKNIFYNKLVSFTLGQIIRYIIKIEQVIIILSFVHIISAKESGNDWLFLCIH